MRILAAALVATFTLSAMAFDKSELDFMRENNMLEQEVLLHEDEWAVKPLNTEDIPRYKGQGKSLVDWEELDVNTWLDFRAWKMRREERDEKSNWRRQLRDLSLQEVVGKVIQCRNRCSVYAGDGNSSASFGGVLKEGDEFATGADSYAWILLADATLVRISPETSLSFLEVNFSTEKAFFSIRLNHGHAYFQQRRLGIFPKQDRPETDLAMYPLLVKEANREFFARQEFRQMKPGQKLLYELEDNPGHVSQYKVLNEMLEEQKERAQKGETEIFLFTANASFLVENPNFHVFRQTAGETWIKLNRKIQGLAEEDSRRQKAVAFFRGYKNKKEQEIEFNLWHAMNPEGEELVAKHPLKGMGMLDYFATRIPSVHLAREILLKKNFPFFFKDRKEEILARDSGYRLWEKEELSRRKEFLKEYTRRMETTNLRSLAKVFSGRKGEGFGKRHYQEAMSRTLMALKDARGYNKEIVKESDNAEYYLWILKNADSFLPTNLR